MLGVTQRNVIRNPAREQITAAIKAALDSFPNRSELARRIGVSRKQTYEWESGNNTPSLETLAALAEATGVPIVLAFGPAEAHEEAPAPQWARGLADEILERIDEAIAGGSLPERVADRLAVRLGLPRSPNGAGAHEGPPEPRGSGRREPRLTG